MCDVSSGCMTWRWFSLSCCISVTIVQHFILLSRLSSSELASLHKENVWGQASITRSLMVSVEIRENMPFKLFSQPSREMKWGFCMRNIVVSKHKATLCSTASSSENLRHTEDQLQRWKWGQGGFFLLLLPKIKPLLCSSPLLSSPRPKLRAVRTLENEGCCCIIKTNSWPSWVKLSEWRHFFRCLYHICCNGWILCNRYTNDN